MSNNKGFSLIEVLVALLLTTIGVLGMVALQGRSIQYTQDSVQRNTAVSLANELIEIARANPQALYNSSVPKFPINSGMKEDSLFYKAKGDDFATATRASPPQRVLPKPQRSNATAGPTRLKQCFLAEPRYSRVSPASAAAQPLATVTVQAPCSKFASPGRCVTAPA